MYSRIALILLTLFWLTMSYLLWRSEYVGHNEAGSKVPVELVWRKILTAPDTSSLEILHNGRRVGLCQWASSISQELSSGKMLSEETLPEVVPKKIANYRLHLEGNLTLGELPSRLKFDSEIKLATNNVWQELNLSLRMKPSAWEVHSLAREESVRFTVEDTQGSYERTFKFADLQNPQMFMEEFDLPAPLGLLGALSPFSQPRNAPPLSLGLQWQARNDWVAIGHTSVRAYRLEATVLERYHMLIIVSRVGEILRVELPDNWELENDQLNNL